MVDKGILSPAFLKRLERMHLEAQRVIVRHQHGVHQRNARGAGIEFAGHRPYSPGDDVRYLDWAALGRLGQLVLKQFELYGTVTLALFIDCSASMDYGEPNKFERMRELAAALGYIALRSGDPTVLATFNAQNDLSQRYRGQADVTRFLNDLARISAQRGVDNPSETVDLSGLRHTTAFVLSDFLFSDVFTGLLSKLRRVPLTCVYPLAPQELEPQAHGPSRATFIDGGSSRFELDEGLIDVYREELRKRRNLVASTCAHHGAGFLEIVSDTALEEMVREFSVRGLVRVGQA